MSSPYENTRLERIKENRERMQRLGLFELTSKLTSVASSASTRGRKRRNPVLVPSNSTPLPPPGPARRSSRLQNVMPVSYSEAGNAKTERISKDKLIRLEVGSRPEVYTEEHEKLLGSTEKSWTLFVDGYGSDGRRIYDPIKGKSCHQCRQKTLGCRTHCSNCEMARGQFCGDCLYMRYGEHVLEAQENENWICPVCRGICNCSFCRQAKGWLPTGPLYKKISSLGYKSVAHYLIQTQRSKEDATIHQSSAKRSLPFPDTEASLEKSTDLITVESSIFPQPREMKDEEKMSGSGDVATHQRTNGSLQFYCEKGDVTDLDQEADEGLGTLEYVSQGTMCTSADGCPSEPSHIPTIQTLPVNLEISEVNHGLIGQLANDVEHTDEEVNDAEGSGQILDMKPASNIEPSPDSIASRLRQARVANDGKNQTATQVKDKNHAANVTIASTPIRKRKPNSDNEPNLDSTSTRLRQRRQMVKHDGI